MIEEQHILPAIPAEIVPEDIGDGIALVQAARLSPEIMARPASGAARSLTSVDGKLAYANDLHRQCNDLTDQARQVGTRLWQTAVVLGAVLTQIKRECPHGAWLTLFSDGSKSAKVKSSNSDHVRNFSFGNDTARNYMKLYKAVSVKVKGLSLRQSYELESLQKGEVYDVDALAETLSQLTDATTLRQAYFDLGVLSPPKSKEQAMLENRNEAGRPRAEGEADPDAVLEEQKRLAERAVSKFAVSLESFMEEGRFSLLDSSLLSVFADTLSASLGRVKEAIKARRSKTDSSDGTPISTFNTDGFDLPEVSIL